MGCGECSKELVRLLKKKVIIILKIGETDVAFLPSSLLTSICRRYYPDSSVSPKKRTGRNGLKRYSEKLMFSPKGESLDSCKH